MHSVLCDCIWNAKSGKDNQKSIEYLDYKVEQNRKITTNKQINVSQINGWVAHTKKNSLVHLMPLSLNERQPSKNKVIIQNKSHLINIARVFGSCPLCSWYARSNLCKFGWMSNLAECAQQDKSVAFYDYSHFVYLIIRKKNIQKKIVLYQTKINKCHLFERRRTKKNTFKPFAWEFFSPDILFVVQLNCAGPFDIATESRSISLEWMSINEIETR